MDQPPKMSHKAASHLAGDLFGSYLTAPFDSPEIYLAQAIKLFIQYPIPIVECANEWLVHHSKFRPSIARIKEILDLITLGTRINVNGQ